MDCGTNDTVVHMWCAIDWWARNTEKTVPEMKHMVDGSFILLESCASSINSNLLEFTMDFMELDTARWDKSVSYPSLQPWEVVKIVIFYCTKLEWLNYGYNCHFFKMLFD